MMKYIQSTMIMIFTATLGFGVSAFQQSPPLIDSIGVTAPFNKFDPLQLSKNIDSIEYARLREAEIKHGRWAMISATSIPLLESQNHIPAIHAYDKLDHPTQITIAALILMGEFATMLKGYENPFVKGSPFAFKLRDDYQPGDMGLHVYDFTDPNFKDISNKELNNGRLAMIGALGFIAQELVTNKPIF